jgi:hypothetical protein
LEVVLFEAPFGFSEHLLWAGLHRWRIFSMPNIFPNTMCDELFSVWDSRFMKLRIYLV